MAGELLDPNGELRSLANDCVHCGFCLPACPTYQLWGEEMDSPRGRIHLISQILDSGEGTAAAAEHFDRCLGCMACMTACPSGVQYDQLIEAARTWAEPAPAGARGVAAEGTTAEVAPAPLPARSRRDRAVRAAIFATFPYADRLRAAARSAARGPANRPGPGSRPQQIAGAPRARGGGCARRRATSEQGR